jgi:hypothetical protein
VFATQKRNGTVAAGGTLTKDQYNEDQVVALQYQDGGRKSSGLTFGERPDTMGKELAELYRVVDPIARKPTARFDSRAMVAWLAAN